jgi:hypothetical protein
MAGRFLHVSERDAGVEGGGDERVAEGVRADRLVDPGAAGEAARDPPGRVAVRPLPPRKTGPSTRSTIARSIARATRGASGMVTTLPPSRSTVSVAVTAREAERFDVGAERLGHAQTNDGQKRDERVLPRRGETGSDEERAHLVAIQAGGVGLVVEPRPANADGGERSPILSGRELPV